MSAAASTHCWLLVAGKVVSEHETIDGAMWAGRDAKVAEVRMDHTSCGTVWGPGKGKLVANKSPYPIDYPEQSPIGDWLRF